MLSGVLLQEFNSLGLFQSNLTLNQVNKALGTDQNLSFKNNDEYNAWLTAMFQLRMFSQVYQMKRPSPAFLQSQLVAGYLAG